MGKKEDLQKIKLDIENVSHRLAILKNDLKRRGLDTKSESKAKTEAILHDLEKRKKELEESFSAIQKASEDKWDKLKSKLSNLLKDLQKALDSAMKKFK